MAREPAVTYEGALRLLGHREGRWLQRIDVLLGGVLLGAGVASLVSPLAGVTALAAMWGWVDQKNEAVKLVSEALERLPGRLRETAGLERRQLVIAAHSTVVVAAYFEVLREVLGAKQYRHLDLTEGDKARLAAPELEHLYRSEIPAPSTRAGFAENQDSVRAWIAKLNERVRDFVGGLAAGAQAGKRLNNEVVERAVGRYTTRYTDLAATVPEFRVWAEFGEHAATRTALRDLGAELSAALDGRTAALARLENLLVLTAPGAEPADDLRATVRRANRAELDEPIIPSSAGRHYGRNIVFPPVGRVFVNPRYRFGVSTQLTRPGDETWWRDRDVHDDLDLRLTAHLTSAEASHRPLLVLGHPGAGKSLLTKVLAARLPAKSYTVVRVPLRRVVAHTPMYEQVQQALDRVTHRRVTWADLVEQSVDTVRVVLLDGLDELLQQDHTRLYGYLHDVVEFQRTEANQGRPVVVLVTSRTTVTDRVDIPDATPILKLEEFDDRQIGDWLDEWNEANAPGIAARTTRAFSLEVALRQRELTGHPLLLLMMALYVSDPIVPVIEEKLSSAELYRRLLLHFAQRQAAKSPVVLTPDQTERSVDDQLRRLSTAALGMFNRGRQDVTAEELGTDLAALEKSAAATAHTIADLGQQVIGEFFFVHTAEARFLSAERPQRQYEFLHATFGEYLVAARVTDELVEVADAAFSAKRRMREPDDDLLFALLSHETLAVRRPTLTFAAELCAGLDRTDRDRAIEVLDMLIAGYRGRTASARYQEYRPRPVDRVRELAAYSVNLVLLRVALHPGDGLPLNEFLRDHDDPLVPWRALIALWQAGLDDESGRAIVSSFRYRDGLLFLREKNDFVGPESSAFARLAGDLRAERVARFGAAFVDREIYADEDDAWADTIEPWLALGLSNHIGAQFPSIMMPDHPGIAQPQLSSILERLGMLLKIRASATSIELADAVVRLVLDNRGEVPPDPFALIAAILAHPRLLTRIPELKEASLYDAPGIPLMLQAHDAAGNDSEAYDLAELRYAIQQRQPDDIWINERLRIALGRLLRAHRWPDPDS